MKKVIILTAGFGEGHNAAARNIRDALELVSDEVQVEVLDLFESTYGSLNEFVKKAYLGLVRYAPGVWGGIYSLLDNNEMVGRNLGGLTKLKNALDDILTETQPDCVVSTYPVYAHLIQDLYKALKLITVVTDSISVNSAWFKAPSDIFCVPNQPTAKVMIDAGVSKDRIKVLGFPVSHVFAEPATGMDPRASAGDHKRILYIINTGKKKAGKVIDRLLEMPDLHLTLTVGRDAELKSKLLERTKGFENRIDILGWTNQMPELMMSHHLIIGKAGGATVQEAIAAKTPMIVNQVIPGQEEGNALLIEELGLGAIAEKRKEVVELVEEAFIDNAKVWKKWRSNLEKVSRPDAAVRIAEMILAESGWNSPTPGKKITLFEPAGRPMRETASVAHKSGAEMLLCDFHIHTTYSDGKLSVPDVVDLYGRNGFDCICITDHVADPRRLIGKLVKLSNLTLNTNQFQEYFEVLERERKRAWRKYGMIVMTGAEFNKDGYTSKSSAHLLGIDLKAPINPALDLPETIEAIHDQGGLAVASHPHVFKSEWGKNTLFLWDNQEQFAPLLDAWEIANRNDIFNPVGLKKLPFLANSDFHKPKHLYSWKTLLHCHRNAEDIKRCIRKNEHVAITLFRDFPREKAMGLRNSGMPASDRIVHLQHDLPFRSPKVEKAG